MKGEEFVQNFAAETFDDELLGYPMKSFEFDLVFGAGTGIIPFIDVDFRVVLGMTNIFEDKDFGLGKVVVDASNLQFVLGATYWF